MILKKHQIQIPCHDEVYLIEHVYLEGLNGLIYALVQVGDVTMENMKKKAATLDGPPIYWNFRDRKITLHPRPDKDYQIKIRYVPSPRYLGEETVTTETQFGGKLRADR